MKQSKVELVRLLQSEKDYYCVPCWSGTLRRKSLSRCFCQQVNYDAKVIVEDVEGN